MLTVHYGPFQPALENAFLARLAELRAQAPAGPIAVVAPSRRLADRLERLAAVEAGLPLLGVRFHTFHSLAEAILDDAGWPSGRWLGDPVFHDRLVDGLLAALPGPAAAVRPRALASAVRASLRDLRDAGVSAEALREHFGDELPLEPAERARLSSLLSLLDAYEAKLRELGLLSPAALPRLAAERAADSEWLGSLREVLYYGFYDLTGLQLEFFEAVAARAPARLYFPFRKGHPAFRFAEPFFEEKLLRSPVEALPDGPSGAVGPALDRLFQPDAPPAAAGPESLRVFSASGARDEVWTAAKEILALVESEGYAFEEIGVVARVLEPYRAAIAEIFPENRIPYDGGAPEPLLREPSAKHVWNLLSLARRDFPASAVLDLAASPYFAGLPPARLRAWKDAARRLGIVAGWLQWRKLESAAARDADLAALWSWLESLREELARPAASWAELSRRAGELVRARLRLPPQALPAERAAWDGALAAIAELEAFDLLGAPTRWDEFLDALEEKLRRASLEPPSGRGVRVRDAMEARGESFRALVLIGLKEKLFPRVVSEDPLLREPARAVLRHPAGYWIARKSAGHEEERLLFYLACASAREKLICVAPRSDEQGKAELPSLYLRELCRAAGRGFPEEAERVPREPMAKLAWLDPARLAPREAALLAAQAGGPAGAYLRAGGEEGELFDGCLAALPELLSFGRAGPRDGMIGPPAAFLAQLRGGGLSPTALDTLALCPFRFFAERLLGLGERELAAERGEFAAWMRGKLYHAALERYYGGPERGPDALSRAVDSVFAENGWRELGLYPLLWKAARSAVSERLARFIAWDEAECEGAGFAPRWHERELSAPWPGPLPPALAGLPLTGRLDRVDVSADGRRFRVIDYKTRRRLSGRPAAAVARGELHQLPLYAELAAAALGGAELESARLYNLEDSPEETGRPRVLELTAAEWTGLRDAFYAETGRRLEELAAGRFPIRPQDGEFGHCARCGLGALCRKSHGPSRARAERASALIKEETKAERRPTSRPRRSARPE